MGRFSNLEPAAAPRPVAPTWEEARPVAAARDENACLRDAEAAWRRGRPEVALKLYSRALEFDPNLPAAWAGQARMLLEQGELVEARLWSSKGLELFREHPELLAARAIACLRLGESGEALAYADAALATRMPGSFPWLARAEILLAHGGEGAEACLRKAVELAGGQAWVMVLAARVGLIHRQTAAALDWARQAAAREPRLAPAWLVMAEAQAVLGLIPEARSALEQAETLDRDLPGLAGLRRQLAGCGWWASLRRLWS